MAALSKEEMVAKLGGRQLRVLICCGGGFSSSAMAKKVKDDINRHGLKDSVFAEFKPFVLVDEVIDDYDVIMCCPHLQYYVDRYVKEHHPTKPLYLIPPKMYGSMAIQDVMIDAIDVIDIFEKDGSNPVHFPGEENLLAIQRHKAYRREHK